MSSPPVKYLRYFDFTTYATNNPNQPLPGASVDVELNRIKSTSDQTIDRLALIQRDDGGLRDGLVTSSAIADGAVTTPKIADLAVTTPKIADGAVTGPKIAPGSLTGAALAPGSIDTVQLKDGGVATVDLADHSVTTVKLAFTAVGTSEVADNAITLPKLADGSVSTNKLIDLSVTNPKLAALAVGTGNVQDNAITLPKLNDNSVSTLKLIDLSVTTPKLADGAVTTAKIAPGAVDSSKLAPGAVTPGAIPDGSITSAKILDGTLVTADYADGSVTLAKLAPNSVDSSKIVDGTIAPADLSASTLALITSAGNPRGPWVTATNYAAKDSVTMGSGVFIALAAHLSGVFADDLAAGKWMQTGQIFDQSLNKADGPQFAWVRLGGTTAAFPMIINSGAELHAKTADNLGFATVRAQNFVSQSGQFYGGNGTSILTPADGTWRLLNAAGTDFNMVQFGGSAAAFPALRRLGAELQSVKADISDYAPFTAQSYNVARLGAVVLPNEGMFSPGAPNALAWSTAAIERMRLDNQGNLSVTGNITGNFPGIPNANKVINGDMRIDQRNNGAAVTPNFTFPFVVDRWQCNATTANPFTAQQNYGGAVPPPGFGNYIGMHSLAATVVGATDRYFVDQGIETQNLRDLSFGTAGALPIALSFWARSTLVGNFGGSVSNVSQNRSFPFLYNIAAANTWTKCTVLIPGDVAGAWNGIYLRFALGMGATFKAPAGAWVAGDFRSANGAVDVVATNGADLFITGVKLEAGTVATPFVADDYEVSLAKCQRYFYRRVWTGTDYVALLSAYSGSTFVGPLFSLPVQMWTAPTLVQSGGLVAWTPNQSGNAGMSLVTLRSNNQQVWCGDSSAVGSYWAAGQSVLVTAANVTFAITCEAEF